MLAILARPDFTRTQRPGRFPSSGSANTSMAFLTWFSTSICAVTLAEHGAFSRRSLEELAVCLQAEIRSRCRAPHGQIQPLLNPIKTMNRLVWGLVLLLIILHQDVWFWSNASLLFGFLPIGLAYHIGISLGAAFTWSLAALYCWPADLDEAAPVRPETTGGSAE